MKWLSALWVALLIGVAGCPSYVTVETAAPLEETSIESIGVLPIRVGAVTVPDRAARLARHELVRALREAGFHAELESADAPPRTDAQLNGTLLRFEHRVGGDLGVSRPASVNLHVVLTRSEDGMLLWKGEYHETQRPTSESLGDVALWPERGWRWLTAEQLLRYGADQLARTLEAR